MNEMKTMRLLSEIDEALNTNLTPACSLSTARDREVKYRSLLQRAEDALAYYAEMENERYAGYSQVFESMG